MKSPPAKTDPVRMLPCGACGVSTSHNARGQVLMHTVLRYGAPAEICPGTTKGARP